MMTREKKRNQLGDDRREKKNQQGDDRREKKESTK